MRGFEKDPAYPRPAYWTIRAWIKGNQHTGQCNRCQRYFKFVAGENPSVCKMCMNDFTRAAKLSLGYRD